MDRRIHAACVNARETLSPNELSFTPIEYLIFALCFRHRAKRDFLMNKPSARKKERGEKKEEGMSESRKGDR